MPTPAPLPVRIEVLRRARDGRERLQAPTVPQLTDLLRAVEARRVRDEDGRPLVARVVVWLTPEGADAGPDPAATVGPAAATVGDVAAQKSLPL